MGKKKKGGKDGFKKKCCDKPVRKMCKRCPRRQALAGGTATRAACSLDRNGRALVLLCHPATSPG